MELIIVILFFSIASVVCVQLFVNAYKTNISTKESSKATLITQNLAEGYLGCDGDIAAMEALYTNSSLTDAAAELRLFYDTEWNESTSEGDAAYIASIKGTAATSDSDADSASGDMNGGFLKEADIIITSADGREISSQHISHYEQFKVN